jgi:leucyl aminopeptidase (aminopeptidase T)
MTKLQTGAINLVEMCLEIKMGEKVVIVTELAKADISNAICEALDDRGIEYLSLNIEDFIERPAKTLAKNLLDKIREFMPNISIYAASGMEGELPNFRRPLIKFLTAELDCRHAHMIGIDTNVFEIGMNQDYNKIFDFTNKLTQMLKETSKIRVGCPFGTNVEFEIDNAKYRWIPCTGKIVEQGTFSNLPDGETFTYPSVVNGKIVAWVLGDTFDKDGALAMPLTVEVKDSYITSINCENKDIEDRFRAYVEKYPDGNRVGELGIGSLLNLKSFTGNLLLDEKYPGVHIAFGFPYPEVTGAQWNTDSHIDIIPKEVDIEIFRNGVWERVMEGGKFLG